MGRPLLRGAELREGEPVLNPRAQHTYTAFTKGSSSHMTDDNGGSMTPRKVLRRVIVLLAAVGPDFDTVIAKAQVGGGAAPLFVPTLP